MMRQVLTFHLTVDNPADPASAPPELSAFTDKLYDAVQADLLHLHPSLVLEDIATAEDAP